MSEPTEPPILTAGFPDVAAEVLARGCRLRFRAAGNSMLPEIRSGEVLLCEPVRNTEARPGEVLLYRSGPRLIAHRLVRWETAAGASWLRMQGDAPRQQSERIPLEAVLGRVTAVERGAREVRLPARPAWRRWVCRAAWEGRARLAGLRAASRAWVTRWARRERRGGSER